MPEVSVTTVALVLGIISFLLYIAEAIAALRSKPIAAAKRTAENAAALAAPAAKPPSLDELTKLLEALSKVTDSLSKAGPSLTSLIAAVLFIAIAAWSSNPRAGIDTSKPPQTHQNAPAPTH